MYKDERQIKSKLAVCHIECMVKEQLILNGYLLTNSHIK